MDVRITKTKDGKHYNQYNEQVVKCELCLLRDTTMLGTKRCNTCWELERRIRIDLHLAKKIIAKIEGYD